MKTNRNSKRNLSLFLTFAGLFLFVGADAFAQDIPGIPMRGPVTNVKPNDFKLGSTTPNELEGYKFFSHGLIDSLRLGVSTRADVLRIFASMDFEGRDFCYYDPDVPIIRTAGCRQFSISDFCDYNSDWYVQFNYFNDTGSGRREYMSKNGKPETKVFYPAPEYLGKLRSIRFSRKRALSFKNVTFPAELRKYSSFVVTLLGRGEKENQGFDYYSDTYGLTYQIINEKFYSNRGKGSPGISGNLAAIEYRIPENFERKMYVEKKSF